MEIRAKTIILAMGCRERPRGAINIQGTRPAGVFSAGTAQKYVNLEGFMPGQEVVILGSGDIGLIMARRMEWEGADVKAVVELMPYSGGLRRNIAQCVDDFDIPLYYSHTITNITGQDRVESVTISKVDDSYKPIPGTEKTIKCDTILLSVGLIPENELSQQLGLELSPITHGPVVDDTLQTSMSGVFATGNVLHVHDLVDYVSDESSLAGQSAARYVKGQRFDGRTIKVTCRNGIRYTIPTSVRPEAMEQGVMFRFRVDGQYSGKRVAVFMDDVQIHSQRKRFLSPGEMETLSINKEVFTKYPDAREIRFELED